VRVSSVPTRIRELPARHGPAVGGQTNTHHHVTLIQRALKSIASVSQSWAHDHHSVNRKLEARMGPPPDFDCFWCLVWPRMKPRYCGPLRNPRAAAARADLSASNVCAFARGRDGVSLKSTRSGHRIALSQPYNSRSSSRIFHTGPVCCCCARAGLVLSPRAPKCDCRLAAGSPGQVVEHIKRFVERRLELLNHAPHNRIPLVRAGAPLYDVPIASVSMERRTAPCPLRGR